MAKLSIEEVETHKKIIDNMSQIEMAKMWRFEAPGHLYFGGDTELSEYFLTRFKKLGFFTPEISKKIGW